MLQSVTLRGLFAFLAAAAFASSTAQAQLFRAYLSSAGSDANPCTLQQPCRLLPAALNAVANGGEIWMLDSANYNAATVNVNKSVSILAVPGVVGSVVATGGPAINVGASDLVVALRNLVIGPVVTLPPGTVGVRMESSGTTLIIENSLVANLAEDGVFVQGAGNLKIARTTLRNNGGYAVSLNNGARAAISGTQMLNNFYGGVYAFNSAETRTTTASIDGCVISGGIDGVLATNIATASTARISITRSTIEKMAYGMSSATTDIGNSEVNVGSSLIANNQHPWDQDGSGSSIRSLGNNQMRGNGTPLGVLTPLAPQ
jgi:hypothetical protein